MQRALLQKPSASMVVAMMALVFAVAGTATAAGKLTSGDKLIKKHSLSGNRLHTRTITGTQINMHKLGKVPSALNADHATTADTATRATSATNATSATSATNAANATNATKATSAERIGSLIYRSAPFIVRMDSRATGTVACSAGTFATGGGTTSPNESATTTFTDYLIDSHPTSDRAGWQATVENETGADITETVWAVCAPASTTG